MKKDLIINATTSETRMALLEDGKLVELFVERPRNERTVGNIYKGKVRKVMTGMQAVFVDIGWEQDAFLHFSDATDELTTIVDDIDRENGQRITNRNERKFNLHPGQEVLVQIVKEPLGNKGPRVTTEVSLPGRLIVLVPHQEHIGVSRRISNYKEKRRLKSITSKIKPPGFGMIIRTVADGKSIEDLKADMEYQLDIWKKLERKPLKVAAPSLVFKDMSLASSVIRDLFTKDTDSLVVDSIRLLKQIKKYLVIVAPSLLERVSYYDSRKPIFDSYKIESEIEKSLQRKVWLDGGGYIIIEQTEALVTIDVNSGRFMGKKRHEDNSLKVNFRAAREICRQLRLRDLGGIIVIDFIDMWEEKNRKKIYDEMRKELRKDRSKNEIAPISQFGLLEMTRQRKKPSLISTFNEPCPHCNGTGMVASLETAYTRIERFVKRFRNRSREKRMELRVNPIVYKHLTQGVQSPLRKIMMKNLILINLKQDDMLKIDEFVCYSPKKGKDVTDKYLI